MRRQWELRLQRGERASGDTAGGLRNDDTSDQHGGEAEGRLERERPSDHDDQHRPGRDHGSQRPRRDRRAWHPQGVHREMGPAVPAGPGASGNPLPVQESPEV